MILENGGHITESSTFSANRWPNKVNLANINNMKSDLSISMTGYTMVKLNPSNKFSNLEAIQNKSSTNMLSVLFAAVEKLKHIEDSRKEIRNFLSMKTINMRHTAWED